jgi:hypothetical protein
MILGTVPVPSTAPCRMAIKALSPCGRVAAADCTEPQAGLERWLKAVSWSGTSAIARPASGHMEFHLLPTYRPATSQPDQAPQRQL